MRPSFTQAGLPLALGAALLFSACGGGSGSGGAANTTEDKLEVVGINVLAGQEWKINRPIDITFNRDVDFSTVNFNTINLVNAQGMGATGVFSQPFTGTSVNRRMIRFQPTCPKLEGYSDAGLLPASTYRLTVRGAGVGGTAVTDTAGEELAQGAVVEFSTPDSDDPLVLFVDTTAGPPVVVVRGLNDDPALPASSLILGGIEQEFLWSVGDQAGRLTFEVPLNHYSIEENQLQVVLQFNQPVDATAGNINSDLIELQYATISDPTDDDFTKMQTEVELVQNCSERGASVRVQPLGLVPQDSTVRIMLYQGFNDLIGDGTTSDLASFAVMETVTVGEPNALHPGIGNPAVDDLHDTFSIGGDVLGSLEDTQAVEEFPPAKWGEGILEAAFDFNGTGGPGGDFDWHILPNTEVVLDTVSDTIVGGPGGAPTKTQAVINGVVDIRDLKIPAGSRLRIVGPNVCTILASGTVKIEGEVSVNGSDSQGVVTLNTTNQPEQGAKGNAGGGDGGVGSFLTTQSTPRGGRGFGAFGAPNLGGEGGETGYAPSGKVDRRGAGGGGGQLGPDIYHLHANNSTTPIRVQTLIGMDAEPGAPGGLNGLGAVSQSERAQGGEVGPSPFIDPDPDNNFLGTMILFTDNDNDPDGVVLGELDDLLAGAGGGGGGDAVNSDSFPKVPFKNSGDEKGAGGGGGAGGLRILAIGDITIGAGGVPGSITAIGGDGGGGENTSYFDRVGGGSGAGAGGHVVLSTAANIIFHGAADGGTVDEDFWYRDDPGNSFHDQRPITLTGGQGGAGNQSAGGANETGPSNWTCDSIPTYFDGGLGGTVPPFKPSDQFFCFHAQPDKGDPSGHWTVGAGGDGGPGILQLHVDDPDTNLQFLDVADGTPYSDGKDISLVCAPPPLGWKGPGSKPDRMVPFFGSVSQSQSKWIPLGLARIKPDGGLNNLIFDFEGTNSANGVVPGDGDGAVSMLPPILGPLPIGSPTYTMVLDASGLALGDEVYAQNPRLLEGFTVMLEDSADTEVFQNYDITDAVYDTGLDRFTMSLDPNGENPAQFIAGGSINAYVVPHFVRVITNGIADSYPDATEITIEFDAAQYDGNGLITNEFGFTPDISDLFPPSNLSHWDVFRFKVHFNIDKDGGDIDITTARPGLDHLRVHFTF